MPVTTWSVAEVVASFREDALLSGYADKAQASMISGEELVELTDADAVFEVFGVKSNLMLKKITKAIEALIAVNDSGALTSEDALQMTSPPIPSAKQLTSQLQASAVDLPPDKFHYFCSHKVRFDHSYIALIYYNLLNRKLIQSTGHRPKALHERQRIGSKSETVSADSSM